MRYGGRGNGRGHGRFRVGGRGRVRARRARGRGHGRFGGAIDDWIDAPSLVAFQATPLQTFWPLVVLAIGAVEVQSGAIGSFKTPEEGMWELKESHEMGDLGFDPLGLKPANADGFKSMQTKELNNGRLAMLAIAGMVAQECATRLQL